jgi:predicted aldo/keto reductase-like oxidoreductase
MLLYGHDIAKRDYQRMAVFAGPKAQASNCIACGECEDKCPQQIPISDWMAKIQKEFA